MNVKKIAVLLLILLITICMGVVLATKSTLELDGSASGGANLSSSLSSIPDYQALFPEDKVQRIDISIAPDDWQTMLDDMTSQYGEFGNSSRMQMGGQAPGNPGMNRPGEMGMPGGPGMDSGDSDNPVVVPARVTVNNVTLEKVGVRFKGQSSLEGSWKEGSYKISMKLNCDEYEDEYPELKNQKLFGFDELSLKSGFKDNSLIKDKVVPDIFRSAGIPAPKTAFYQVYVDTGNGPVYFGVYTLIEDVADTLITSQFANGSGNLYKAENMRTTTFVNSSFNVSGFDKETNKKKGSGDLEHLYTALNSNLRTTDPVVWRSGLESILNVDEFITWLAANTIIQNWDTYGMASHNFFLYDNPDDGRFVWIPWDNNEALQNRSSGMGGMGGGMRPDAGNISGDLPMAPPGPDMMQVPSGFGNGTGMPGSPGTPGPQMGGDMKGVHPMGGQLSTSLDEVSDQWPLIRYLMDDPVYHEKYVKAVENVITSAFDPEKLKALYTKNHDLIAPYVIGENGEQKGYTLLKNPEEFNSSLDALISHADSRYADVMAYLDKPNSSQLSTP
jgi:spore coat protein H